jgi:hypothetical protein
MHMLIAGKWDYFGKSPTLKSCILYSNSASDVESER